MSQANSRGHGKSVSICEHQTGEDLSLSYPFETGEFGALYPVQFQNKTNLGCEMMHVSEMKASIILGVFPCEFQIHLISR